MIKTAIFLLSCLLATSATASEFFETKADIIKALKGENKSLGKKRSLFGDKKVRGLKRKKTVMVMKTDDVSGKTSKISYTTGDEIGSANMRVEFDLGSAQLRKTSYPLLDELGKALNDPDLNNKKLIIAGHTDDLGDNEYNMNLSLQRAHAVRYYLNKKYSIHKNRLETLGFGEENPLVNNSNNVNRQMNRRVEIIHGAQ
jgi:outer membrane protein OmpA-like peptidoglycan-associated protein